ncbi:MAG: hypothetical protein ACLRSE_07775 [Alistipes finegoldii]
MNETFIRGWLLFALAIFSATVASADERSPSRRRRSAGGRRRRSRAAWSSRSTPIPTKVPFTALSFEGFDVIAGPAEFRQGQFDPDRQRSR